MSAAEDLHRFEEFAFLTPPGEVVGGEKVVVLAVYFSRPRRSCRGRDAQLQSPAEPRQHLAQYGRLAGA
jgi:hypothetical protein